MWSNIRAFYSNNKIKLNYFSKNLKKLRADFDLSQEKFARLFDLSQSNVKSYERGVFPKPEKFIEIMDHFSLDPSKFISCDMERQSVYRDTVVNEQSRDQILDNYVNSGLSETDKFRFYDDFTIDQLKELLIKTTTTKEQLLKENLDLKEKYIQLLEQNQTPR